MTPRHPWRRNGDAHSVMKLFDLLPGPLRVALLYLALFIGLPALGIMVLRAPTAETIPDVLPWIQRGGDLSTLAARVRSLEATTKTLANEHKTLDDAHQRALNELIAEHRALREQDVEIRSLVRHTFCEVTLSPNSNALEFQRCLANVEEYMRRNRSRR